MLVAGALIAGACSSENSSKPSATTGAALPSAAQEIVDRPAYEYGSWTWDVVDQQSGATLYASQQDRLNLLASTTKLFTTGTYLDQVGPDATLETPVYSTGTRTGADLQGDLVLVGSGDFVLGSRGVLDGGDLQFQSPDHVYFYASPTVQRVAADPLAGLDELAAQVKASGITSVNGDVLVDDRLWKPYDSKEGVVTPIMVNDNILDIAVTPGAAAGDTTSVDVRPQTSYFDVVNEVTTIAADGRPDLRATVEAGNKVVVTGTVPAGSTVQNTGVFAPDPAAYARALFIEALGRAGVTVTAPVAAAASLPAEGSYTPAAKVAALTSPPASVLTKLVLKTSHNRGAESLMCLLAVKAGSKTCTDGLTTMLNTVGKAGVNQSSVFLYDGEGTDPASATPSSIIGWLTWAAEQSWGDGYRLSMPDIAKDGTIMVKSGTSAAPENSPMPSMFMVQGEAGYMTTASGKQVVVAVYVNNGSYPTVAQGLAESGPAVSDWLAAVQKAN